MLDTEFKPALDYQVLVEGTDSNMTTLDILSSPFVPATLRIQHKTTAAASRKRRRAPESNQSFHLAATVDFGEQSTQVTLSDHEQQLLDFISVEAAAVVLNDEQEETLAVLPAVSDAFSLSVDRSTHSQNKGGLAVFKSAWLHRKRPHHTS